MFGKSNCGKKEIKTVSAPVHPHRQMREVCYNRDTHELEFTGAFRKIHMSAVMSHVSYPSRGKTFVGTVYEWYRGVRTPQVDVYAWDAESQKKRFGDTPRFLCTLIEARWAGGEEMAPAHDIQLLSPVPEYALNDIRFMYLLDRANDAIGPDAANLQIQSGDWKALAKYLGMYSESSENLICSVALRALVSRRLTYKKLFSLMPVIEEIPAEQS